MQLTGMQYKRNELDLQRGRFRVKGDVIEVLPAYEETALRIETFGDVIEAIKRVHPATGKSMGELDETTIFPAKHYMTVGVTMEQATEKIGVELEEQLALLRSKNKLLEAQRLEQRTRYDIEMLRRSGMSTHRELLAHS